MFKRTPNPISEELEDCGQRLMDLAENLTYDNLRVDPIEVSKRIDGIIGILDDLKKGVSKS